MLVDSMGELNMYRIHGYRKQLCRIIWKLCSCLQSLCGTTLTSSDNDCNYNMRHQQHNIPWCYTQRVSIIRRIISSFGGDSGRCIGISMV